jgi:two-component system, NtrC family, response regulator AtoC
LEGMSTPMNRVSAQIAEAGFVCGQSTASQSLEELVSRIAPTCIPVLLMGESGTGKEVYAQRIHRLSGLGGAPLTKFSCTSLEISRLLQEIKEGLQATNGGGGAGTLYLDGIDELDLACQRLLLSLLPDGEHRSGVREVTVRLVTSSSRDLKKTIEAGRFRPELFFRLNGVCLRLPPLRERKEDIPSFVEHFLNKHSSDLGQDTPALDSSTMDLLTAYDWPGNIRELENMVKKIIALRDAKSAVSELLTAPLQPNSLGEGTPSFSLKVAARAASQRTERELILKALERTHWNRKRAAQDLQISYKALLYKINQIGVQDSASDKE